MNKYKRFLRISQLLILVAAIVMIMIGIRTGEPFDVFQKAVHICLECIGIG